MASVLSRTATATAAATASDSITPIADLVRQCGLIVAVTDDGADPRFAAVRAAATDIAAARGARVLLFHAPSGMAPDRPGRPRLFVPGADASGHDGGRLHTGARHRDLLGAEAAAIRARSVDVAAWIAPRDGPTGIAEAVARTGADIVLVPDEVERTGGIRRVIRRTLSYYASRIGAPVVSVDAVGRLNLVSPLGATGMAPGRGPHATARLSIGAVR